MIRRSAALLVGILFSSMFMLGAIPMQQKAGPLSVVPWWGWLVIIAVVLLLMFIIVMRQDWKSAPKQRDDKK